LVVARACILVPDVDDVRLIVGVFGRELRSCV